MIDESSILKEFRVTLETVTPLFLGGAESRPKEGLGGMPELRSPSFRGAMRYWFRALVGGIYGDEEQKSVQKAESLLFGSASSNTGHASPVSIRIKNQKLKPPQRYEKIKGPNGRPLFPPAGRDYLYWSMDKSGKAEKGNLLLARHYIPQESFFDFLVSVRATSDWEVLQKYVMYSLWLTTQLGGIGARSRRTAGSLSIRAEKVEGFPILPKIGTKKEIAKQIGETISAMRNDLSVGLNSPKINFPSRFDVLHPNVCKIWVLGVAKSSEGMVKAIGDKMQAYRSHVPAGQNKDTWLLERSIFGIPVKDLKGLERRSSPLWLKVSKMDEYYVGIATLFKSQLLPNGQKISYVDTTGKKQSKSPTADYGIIENWLQGSFSDLAEVYYD